MRAGERAEGERGRHVGTCVLAEADQSWVESAESWVGTDIGSRFSSDFGEGEVGTQTRMDHMGAVFLLHLPSHCEP